MILDAKRGDIGSTAAFYADEAFDRYGADAVTVNPYLGRDALRAFPRARRQRRRRAVPHLESRARAICRISTSAAARSISTSRRRSPREWNANGNCLLVVGATYPDGARRGPRDRRRHAAAGAGCRRAGRRCRGRRCATAARRTAAGSSSARRARSSMPTAANRVRERRTSGDENPRRSDQSASLIP